MIARAIHVSLAATLIAATHAIGAQAPAVRAESLSSRVLGRAARYEVVLPATYDRARKYPILWLLHGFAGRETDWVNFSRLATDAASYDLIVVTPDAANSWYVNAAAQDTASRYEDFFVGELFADVSAKFAIDSTRQAIAGLSMGGYGAVIVALRHPGRYRFVGALSPALSVASAPDSVLTRIAGPSLRRAFGADPRSHAEYDPFRTFRNTRPDSLPYFYVAIGASDGFPTFLPASRAFTDSLRANHARYEYHEMPGSHSWQLWSAELPVMLESMAEIMRIE